MTRTAVLGLPRIGANRELKYALEAYWAGRASADDLLRTRRELRLAGWQAARAAGIDVLPAGDHSLYDHVLDTAWALGAIPARFGAARDRGLDGYFALARGDAGARPLEMTKWFDTNYHYLVPELEPGQRWSVDATHWAEAIEHARANGLDVRPVVLGPLSFLLLAKGLDDPIAELGALTTAYRELLAAIAAAGAREVQIDEPCLALPRTRRELDAFAAAWTQLAGATSMPLTLATYFAALPADTLDVIAALEPAELHLDLVRGAAQLGPALAALTGRSTRLSLGVVDGRNVWATNLDAALDHIDLATRALGGERVTIAASCSLLHLPYTAAREHGIDPEVRAWLAFAAERQTEIALLRAAAAAPPDARDRLLAGARQRAAGRRASSLTNDARVRERVGSLRPADYQRSAPSAERQPRQQARLNLPQLPTTTIGSFPQTDEIRAARRDHREGRIDDAAYERFLEDEIARVVAEQERLGLDVLVHGEPERNDMVEYFGQQLAGFAFSQHGWVQSYGSRCVKPPILYGDVSRPAPMTVRWWQHAQSLTAKPMKGMLTGPVTILKWSFVRDDQPLSETCTQVALAIRDEVLDLEAAGAVAIQVDEAALREGVPLEPQAREDYLRWAIDCFGLTTSAVRPETQVHTHMCYSDFNDIMAHIIRLDADVISIEASRSDMAVLDAFAGSLDYPNEIGPGVWDIHSPRVPSVDEIERLLELAEARIPRDRLWVNPDCGLKTRGWAEVRPALQHMLEATRRRRAAIPATR
ncbi:MAG: 5-methyltetrahydropteroyltriglutamate--homocysteine S-methyltransferase [Solirubrobacteraceae bacterium]